MKKRIVNLTENPMLQFGANADPGMKCRDCKHMSSVKKKGRGWEHMFPVCSLRGPYPHNPNWPACARFLTWAQWRKERDKELGIEPKVRIS